MSPRAERESSDSEDGRLIAAFLEMMAAEAGAARNTLLAYGRDLEGASELLGGRLGSATTAQLRKLGEAWLPLKRATVARKAAALRRFYGFLLDEGLRADDPSATLPRPGTERPLPKILDHRAVDALFAEIEQRKGRGDPRALRMAALVELLYGSGLRATELVSLPRNAIAPDRPFLILKGKGGRERLVPISDRACAAVAEWAAQVPRDALYLFPSGKGHLSRVRLHQLVKALAADAGAGGPGGFPCRDAGTARRGRRPDPAARRPPRRLGDRSHPRHRPRPAHPHPRPPTSPPPPR